MRELGWGLAAVSCEVHAWRSHARTIPDPTLREDALDSLARKRGHTDGAALLWTIPKARHTNLLRLLVAYEIIWDFLDGVNERGAPAGQVNGRQLHLALLDAVDTSRPLAKYYRHHLADDDGGYLRALVEVCRAGCRTLVSYPAIRPLLAREACNAQVLAINHDLDPRRRDADLRIWATDAFPDTTAHWFELTGAASASLTIHALFALGAQPCDRVTLERVAGLYFLWISAATTMLDSYVDQVEDRLNGDHSYVSHYCTPAHAVTHIRELIRRSFEEIRALRDGERHAVIVACMIAMYLAKDSARTHDLDAATGSFIDAGGSLTRLLRPVLRMWRIAYSQRRH
ncbi:MAG TPA: DUF2600 family protein [Solirubrobacteraceae bacterium]|nr:DUF2600 family protein [Solirubrobacteraceae bacterium]